MSPTLEVVLGVGRSTPNKPMRVLEATKNTDVDALPDALVSAVKTLIGESD